MTPIKEYAPLLTKVFKDDIPEDLNIYSSNNHWELEELNPPDAIEVAVFSAEVENWTTWTQKSFFYVCKVPQKESTYLLFSIAWDDNWGRWEREACGAVHGAGSHENVSIFLLRQFGEENSENAGSGEWREVLESLK